MQLRIITIAMLAAASLVQPVAATAQSSADALPLTTLSIDQFGTEGLTAARDVVVIADGILVVGDTTGSLPGQTSAGSFDVFVRKYDRQGAHLWTRQFGTAQLDSGYAIDADDSAVYVAGGSGGPFVRKYDGDGNALWTRQLGNSGTVRDIVIQAGAVYVAGMADVAFIHKLDADGNPLWTRQLTFASELLMDAHDSGLYVTGQLPGVLPGQTADNSTDLFVRRYDADGNELWTSRFGTPLNDNPGAVRVDSSGVYVAASLATAQFTGRGAPPAFDGYLYKFDSSGAELWSRTIRSESSDTSSLQDDRATDLAVAPTGIYVTGRTTGQLSGEPASGDMDGYIRKYDPAGNEAWTHQFGTASGDTPWSIVLDGASILVAGQTSGAMPGGTRSGGNHDAFVVRFADTPAAAPSGSDSTPQPAIVPPSPDTSTPVDVPENGGQSWFLEYGNIQTSGYGRVIPDSGQPVPAALAILGMRGPDGVLVSEASVSASPASLSGRLYVEMNGTVRTGIVLANPNAQAALVQFHFTDETGSDFGAGSIVLGVGEQKTTFFDEAPFHLTLIQATFTFHASVAVGAVALRSVRNERSEFVTTTLPALPLGAGATGAVVLPHFANGGGWRTLIVLTNCTDSPLRGSFSFLATASGDPAVQGARLLSMTVNGVTGPSFGYFIPPRAAARFVTSDAAESIVTGSLRVVPSAGAAPAVTAVFSYRPHGVLVSEASVTAEPPGSEFNMYAESTGDAGTIGSRHTGVALTNPSGSTALVTVQPMDLDGAPAGAALSLSVPPGGHVAKFVHELFPELSVPYRGFVRLTSSVPVAMVGLRGRYNERGEFLITATPPRNAGAGIDVSELLIPHLTSAAQLVVFGKSSTGRVSVSSAVE